MGDRWHKQIAVRFPPPDLAALDRLVAAKVGNDQRAWYSWGPATRSSVILALVKAADAKLQAEAAAEKKTSPARRQTALQGKKKTKRGAR